MQWREERGEERRGEAVGSPSQMDQIHQHRITHILTPHFLIIYRLFPFYWEDHYVARSTLYFPWLPFIHSLSTHAFFSVSLSLFLSLYFSLSLSLLLSLSIYLSIYLPIYLSISFMLSLTISLSLSIPFILVSLVLFPVILSPPLIFLSLVLFSCTLSSCFLLFSIYEALNRCRMQLYSNLFPTVVH